MRNINEILQFYRGDTEFYARPYKLLSDGIWREPTGKAINNTKAYFNAIRSRVARLRERGIMPYSYSTFTGQYIPQLNSRLLIQRP